MQCNKTRLIFPIVRANDNPPFSFHVLLDKGSLQSRRLHSRCRGQRKSMNWLCTPLTFATDDEVPQIVPVRYQNRLSTGDGP